jgi:hypothetical protein
MGAERHLIRTSELWLLTLVAFAAFDVQLVLLLIRLS